MKFLGLIPARGGSKRLPGKNIKLLGDLPLIAWTIRAAAESSVCHDVLVSTDDESIASVAREYGATVLGLRPVELATDTASSVDVALHALDQYESVYGQVDGLILLQPTSPFRTPELIRRGARMFEEAAGRYPVISVSPAESHPGWCFRINQNNVMQPFMGWDPMSQRSQDLEPAYALNGSLYIVAPSALRRARRIIGDDCRAVVMRDRIESIDIDTEFDWLVAEAALQVIPGNNFRSH